MNNKFSLGGSWIDEFECGTVQCFGIVQGEQVFASAFDEDFYIAQENARRIVACLNACEGLTQDHFDGGWSAKEIIAYASNLEKERDAYRDMCVEMLEELRVIKMTVNSPLDAYYIASDAITKASQLLGEKK